MSWWNTLLRLREVLSTYWRTKLGRCVLEAPTPNTHFEPDDRVRGGQRAPVCPQNRAYGSVHGSSRKIYPVIQPKPVR